MRLVDFQKRDPCAEIRLNVNDFSLGLEEIVARENLDENQRVLGKGVHHVQVASVQAEFAHARGDAHIRLFFDKFGCGNECVSGRATLFSTHEFRLRARQFMIVRACRGIWSGMEVRCVSDTVENEKIDDGAIVRR